MKNLLKRSLSVFLVVTIILSSALLGLNKVDFSAVSVSDSLSGLIINSNAVSLDDLCFKLDPYKNTYSVKSCETTAVGDVVIPFTYNGKLVTEIDSFAFENCTSVTSITLPDSVTYIDSFAFKNCTGLTTIKLPESLTEIGSYAFTMCSSLTEITIPENVSYIDKCVFDECTRLEKVYWNAKNVSDFDSERNIFCQAGTSSSGIEIIFGEKVEKIPTYMCFCRYISSSSLIPNITSVTISNSITEIADSAFSSCANLTSVNIPDSVISIGESAFSGCEVLPSITIPSSVTSIGESAFYGCANLSSVHINNLEAWCNIDFNSYYGNPLYYAHDLYINGSLATDIIIPGGLTKINDNVFKDCTSLVSVTIPDNVTSIGESTFSGCTGLPSITIPDSVTSIGDFAFSGCTGLPSITIPDSVTSMGEYAFCGCTGITSVVIPDSLTNIPSGIFEGCSGLHSVTIPESITKIGSNAFNGCSSLTSITIPDSVISIGSYAFSGCSFTSLSIPDSVTSIGNCAFSDSSTLVSVNLGNGLISIYDGTFKNCKNLTTIIFPDSLTTIGDSSFDGCEALSSLAFPDSLISIGEYAFYDCDSLSAVTFGDDLISIGDSSFANCELLSTVTINDGLEKIGAAAFIECPKLDSITIPYSVTAIGNKAFGYAYGINVYNPPYKYYYFDVYGVKGTAAETYAKENGFDFIETACPHFAGDWITYSPATCTQTGTKYKKCTLCGEKLQTGVIEALGHDYQNWSVELEATCTTDGVQNKRCSFCGDAITETLHSLGHDYSTEWTIDVKPTCTQNGSKSHHCSRCESKGNVTVISATGHTDVKDPAVEATCITTGKTEGKHCSVCNAVIVTQQTIPAKGHTSSNWITDKKATVNAKGSKHKECVDCKEVLETAEIPQLKCATPKLKKVENVATGIKFTWNKVTGADNYEIYRKIGSGKWSKIATVKGSVTSYTDKKAKSGTTYKYTVKAKNEAGLSKYNTTGLTIKCLADPVLKAPTSAKKGITLKWNKITGAQGYVVYRKAGNGKFVKLTTVKGASKVSYTDKSAKKGTKYTYKLQAYSSKTYSAYSNAKTIKDKY